MEQRIGSGSQPLEGAGFDPAFIPGLTSPASVAPKGAKKEDAAEEADSEETALDDADEPGTETADVIDDADDDAEDAVDEADEADDEDDDAEDAPVDGPVFEAADRRARIAVDHKGVRLTLDDQECEFRWDEIGAIETETPRFGKRFTITVHTPDRRWYPIEIEAESRARFAEWDEQLDAVMDRYFEDETPETKEEEPEESD